MSKVSLLCLLAVGAVSPLFGAGPVARLISIAGEWRLRLDPSDAGMVGEWFKKPDQFPDLIHLPGSTDEQRFGNKNDARDPGHLTRAYSFIGPVWYAREIDIPEEWKGKHITLFLERCHWQTEAWLDDYPLGLQNSLSTPQIYDLDQPRHAGVTPGHHWLTVRADNRRSIDIGESSAVTEQGPGNWNGIAGSMEIRATDAVWIDRVFAYPDLARNLVHIKLKIRNTTGDAQAAKLALAVGGTKSLTPINIGYHPVEIIERDFPLPGPAQPWSEFSPTVQELDVSLASTSAPDFFDEASTTFGMRALTVAGRQMMLNGRVIHLRGTVDNGSFPLKGYPPTDVSTWRARFQTYKDYGFNHVRFHSWCPPEAAFTAADQLGLILQVENPMWIGDGRISANALRTEFMRQEAEAIVDTYGNHPSFGLMTMGNGARLGLGPVPGEPRAQPSGTRPAPPVFQHFGPG